MKIGKKEEIIRVEGKQNKGRRIGRLDFLVHFFL
jgi:hypothetical protein